MEKTKVLIVGNHPSVKGGITSVIEQILKHDWNDENIEIRFIPTYVEKSNLIKMIYFCISYIRIIFSFLLYRPEVIHIHMSYKGSFFRKYAIHKISRVFGIKDVVHLHGSEFEKWYKETNSSTQKNICKMLRECSSFIVLGEKWKEAIEKIEPNANIVVVSNSVAIPKETTKWNDEKLKILFLGVLIKRKGVADLLKAIHLLKHNRKIDKKLEVIIAGSGEEEMALKAQSVELGVQEYVNFVGWTTGEKKYRLLQESQLLILPSYNEGLPIAILEAISYGLPVIATDVGDISAAVRDGVNGYLFQPGDVEVMAKCIVKITENREEYDKMAVASKRLAEEYFSDKAYFEKLKECYLGNGD